MEGISGDVILPFSGRPANPWERSGAVAFIAAIETPKPLAAQPGWKVAVVTTIVPAIEPLCLLENTLEALVALAYPHDTWVLDEGNDQRIVWSSPNFVDRLVKSF